jgi:hypothetical protein
MISMGLRPVFFGWKVVGTAFTVSAFTFGVGYYGPSVFLNVLHQQRGWPVPVISSAITVHFLVSAVLVTRLPDGHRRFGIATVTQAGTLALVIGMVGWSLAAAPWQLFVAATLSGAGWAATSGAAPAAGVGPCAQRRECWRHSLCTVLGHTDRGDRFYPGRCRDRLRDDRDNLAVGCMVPAADAGKSGTVAG